MIYMLGTMVGDELMSASQDVTRGDLLYIAHTAEITFTSDGETEFKGCYLGSLELILAPRRSISSRSSYLVS
jgi:hypothetical protein